MRFALILLGLVVVVACSRAPTSDAARAQAIEAQVWSPYCPGRLLVDCSTRQSSELRAAIASRIERGESDAQVLEWVRDEFGSQAVARPEGSGSGLLIWLVPAAIFLVGALIVSRVVLTAVAQDKEAKHADP